MASTVRHDDDVESGWRPVTRPRDMTSPDMSSAERLASLEARMNRMDDLYDLIERQFTEFRVGMTQQVTQLREEMTRQSTELRADMNRQSSELRADMNHQSAELRADMNRQFDVMNGQLGELRSDMNQRFEHVDRRFEQVDRRFEQAEYRFQALDAKGDRHFTWIVGVQVALMLAVIGAMMGAYYR
jgi:DNA anti-recombination protein RmuC